jgi:nucleotide-binding universal stress UspA family protein
MAVQSTFHRSGVSIGLTQGRLQGVVLNALENSKKLFVAATERLEESIQQLNVPGEAVVTTGAAGPAILEIAAQRPADLIVVGTIGRTGYAVLCLAVSPRLL